MRLTHQPKKPAWEFLRQMRAYLFRPITKLLASSNRRLKKSKGRQKLPECIPILMDYGENIAIISPITKEHFTNKEKKI